MRLRRTRSSRITVQVTPKDRALVDRAVVALDIDLTTFVIAELTAAARRVLADRTAFVLDDQQRVAWEAINDRNPRDIAGLRSCMDRPAPFVDS